MLAHASKDMMTVIDQTAGCFKDTLFNKRRSVAPVDSNEKTYVSRTARAVRARFDAAATDI